MFTVKSCGPLGMTSDKKVQMGFDSWVSSNFNGFPNIKVMMFGWNKKSLSYLLDHNGNYWNIDVIENCLFLNMQIKFLLLLILWLASNRLTYSLSLVRFPATLKRKFFSSSWWRRWTSPLLMIGLFVSACAKVHSC